MGNPVHTAARLRDELTAALDRLSLPAVRRKELAGLLDAAGDIADQLAFIDENYYVLATDDGVDPVEQVRAIFDALPPGRIATESGLDALTAVSPLLRTLARGGISVTSLRKMSTSEERLGRILGDDLSVIGEIWRQLRADLGHRAESTVVVTKQQMPKVRQLMGALHKLGMCELTNVEVEQGSSKAPTWVAEGPALDVGRLPADHPFRVTVVHLDQTGQQQFFTGGWLDGYATLLVSDHLDAIAVPHEIYTSVAYTHPVEILRGNSDFDVIVHAAGIVAVIECKTGKLTGQHVTKVVGHAEGLATTFRSTGISTDVRHFLLHLDAGGTRQVVEQGLRGSTVQALAPDQLRGAINEIFTDRARRAPATRSHPTEGRQTSSISETRPPPDQPAGRAKAAKELVSPVAETGPLVPVTEVAKREDLRDIAAQVLASDELRAAMAAASFEFPTPLVSLRHVLLELAPVLVGNEWFPALSMTLRWALVGTDYQMADDETHGLVVGRRDTMAAPVADLTEADLSDPKVIVKVLGRHDLAFGQVPLIDYLRWLDSGRALPMPANSYDLVEAYVAQTGCNPRSIVMLSRTLVTTGLATFNDGNFALSMETSDPEHALQVVRRRVDEALEQHRWPDVTEVVDAITGIRRS